MNSGPLGTDRDTYATSEVKEIKICRLAVFFMFGSNV